jgi:hypothetical protein
MKGLALRLRLCSLVLLAGQVMAQDSLNVRRVGVFDPPGDARDVAVSGGYAFVAAGQSGLRVANVSNPESPTAAGFYDSPGYVWVLDLRGSYAYLADYDQGLRVVNISNPASPVSAGWCNTADFSEGVAVSDSFAYLAVGMAGMQVVDIHNPASPTARGVYNSPGYARITAVSGSYAYVADYDGGLRIVNVSNPSAPTQVGFFVTPGDAMGVAVSGDYAYVADRGRGLRIVDVSAPSSPHEVGFCETPGFAWDVAVSGDHAYVVASDRGLRVIDVSDPTAPVEVGFYDTPGTAEGVAVVGNYVYVADVQTLQILEFLGGGGPNIQITPSSQDFGRVRIGTSAERSFSIQNTGQDTLVVDTIQVLQPFTTDFSNLWRIPAGGSQTLTVFFAPDEPVPFSDSVRVYSNAPSRITCASVTGVGARPRIAVAPASLTFDSLFLGNWQDRIFTVRDSGNWPLRLDSLRFARGLQVFSFLPTPSWPDTVPDNDSLSYTIHFVASDTGQFLDTLIVYHDDSLTVPIRVPVYGFGRSPNAADDGMEPAPKEYYLRQNCPNPFNPTTEIEYGIPKSSRVTISIYDIQGRESRRLVDRQCPAGRHRVVWRCSGCASGVYFIAMTGDGFHLIRKAMMLK